MAFIYETENFEVVSQEDPFVSREEGGHARINAKEDIEDRIDLTAKQATELIRLTMLIGESMKIAMNNRGIPVIRINYEDLDNWSYKTGSKPHLHIHIFGRAKNAVKQVFPEAVYLPPRESGFYEGFTPLNEEDIKEIYKQIKILEGTEKYNISNWNI